MAAGLALSRRLMLQMIELGLPVATELLQPLAAGYFDDLLGWAAIGARTSESQVHRELVSGLDLPVGFKNGTDGSLGIATDAMRSAAHAHQHFGIDDLGRPALVQTAGNADTHLVLRGGHEGPNHDAASVAAAVRGWRSSASRRASWSTAATPTAAGPVAPAGGAGGGDRPAPGRPGRPARRDDREPPVRRCPVAVVRAALRGVHHRRLPGLGRHGRILREAAARLRG